MKLFIKTLLTGIVLLFLLLLFSCCTKRVYIPVERITTVREIERVQDTVVLIRLVPDYREVVTDRDSSFLENEYAYTSAKWDGERLFHSLGVIDRDIPVRIQYVDRYVFRNDSVPVPYPVVEYKEVNRLTSLQGFQVWCGRVFLLILFLLGCMKFVRYRK